MTSRNRHLLAFGGLLTTALSLPAAAGAAETTTYTYDALGRVVQLHHSGGDNDGMATTYQHDPAGNRTQLAITGSQNQALSSTVIVVPLNGFTIIPIPSSSGY